MNPTEQKQQHSCPLNGWTDIYIRLKSIAIPLLLGQILAGLIGVTAICSSLLVKSGISLPLTQNLLHYGLLSLCFGSIRLSTFVMRKSKQCTDPATNPKPVFCGSRLRRAVAYIIAGLVDVHANWAIVSAYALTSVTSVQLLDCVTIPSAMLFSYFFLRSRYFWTHYVAMIICLAGAGGMIAADVWANPSNDFNNKTDYVHASSERNSSDIALGDFLVIVGAVAYAASNVMQQYLVVQYGFIDYLTYTGLSACVSILVYSLSLELNDIRQILADRTQNFALVAGCFSGYVGSMFLLYTLMPYVLSRTNAVLVNLSLLTADVYALLMGIYLFHNRFHVVYVLCFAVILLGVGVFSFKQPGVGKLNPLSRCQCCDRRFGTAKKVPTIVAVPVRHAPDLSNC